VTGGDIDDALTAADAALYQAKAEGRNCVRAASR
jgi:PleD family two-component response regulator